MTVSSSPAAAEIGGEAGDANVDEAGGNVCYSERLASSFEVRPDWKAKNEGSSLTAAALGGTTLPELVTNQPLGRPGIDVAVTVLVCNVVAPATQGYTFG